MNPHFFLYPTFYYYFTYLATRFWPFSEVLLHGRMLNMACVGLTGWIAYMFCARHFQSRPAGIVAAIAVVTSPIIAFSGSYLCTDVFLAAATLASIYFLTTFFGNGSMKSWTAGMVLLGLAVGCKYTAFLLFIAYVAQEAALRWREKEAAAGPFVSRRLLVALLGAAGVALVLAAVAFPTHLAIDFVARTRTNPNGRPAAEYMPFFHAVRMKMGAAGALLLVISALVLLVRQAYLTLAPSRLYKGLAIILGMCVVTTPYSLITPKKFILDIGSLAKLNLVVVGGTQQWHDYWTWYAQSETLIFGLALIYIVLYFLVIGTSHKGYPRYFTAILPLLYCFAGYTAVQLAALPVRGRRLTPAFQYAVIACIVAATFYNTSLHVREVRQLASAHDEFWASYTTALARRPDKVLTLGDAPDTELTNAGFNVEAMPEAAIFSPAALSALGCNQLLIVEGKDADAHTLRSTTLKPILDAQGIYGQKVYVQRNCKQPAEQLAARQ